MLDRLFKFVDSLLSNSIDNKDSQNRGKVHIEWGPTYCEFDPLTEPKGVNRIHNQRVTPTWITELEDNEVFVFGSNSMGIHDGGASLMATEKFGAIDGQAEGPQGQSYAIPTDGPELGAVKQSVKSFIVFAKAHPNLFFLVTEIGCGTAGYHPFEIAPMFNDAVKVPNIYLPKSFWKYLK